MSQLMCWVRWKSQHMVVVEVAAQRMSQWKMWWKMWWMSHSTAQHMPPHYWKSQHISPHNSQHTVLHISPHNMWWKSHSTALGTSQRSALCSTTVCHTAQLVDGGGWVLQDSYPPFRG